MRLTDSFSTSSLNSSLVVNKNETTVTIDEKKHDENHSTGHELYVEGEHEGDDEDDNI